jgi:hypothetical protein
LLGDAPDRRMAASGRQQPAPAPAAASSQLNRPLRPHAPLPVAAADERLCSSSCMRRGSRGSRGNTGVPCRAIDAKFGPLAPAIGHRPSIFRPMPNNLMQNVTEVIRMRGKLFIHMTALQAFPGGKPTVQARAMLQKSAIGSRPKGRREIIYSVGCTRSAVRSSIFGFITTSAERMRLGCQPPDWSSREQQGAIQCSIVHSSAWDAAPACSSLTVLVTSRGRPGLNIQMLSSVHTTGFRSQGRSRIGYCDWHMITPISPKPPLIRGVKVPNHGKAMCDYQKKIGHQSKRELSYSGLIILALDEYSPPSVDPRCY